MRDALSSSPTKWSAALPADTSAIKSVIEELDVLDYEYYFRLTDHFLSNDVKDAFAAPE